MNHMLLALASLALFACGNAGSKNVDGDSGKQVYKTHCMACHGVDGNPKFKRYPDLRFSKLTLEERIVKITEGEKLMPAFAKRLTEEQIKAVAIYLDELKQQN